MRIRLSVELTVLLIFLCANLFCEDKKRQEANGILANASQVSDQKPKFHEEVHFTLHGMLKGDLQGTYTRDFVSPEEWQEKVEIGTDFQEVRVRRDKNIWVVKNFDFEP